MGPSNRPRARALLFAAALCLTVGALYWAVAAPYLSSRQEEMTLSGVSVLVTYSDTASADDLRMPFYPEAAVDESFAYTVTTKEGKPVSEYASARLTTSDSWQKVTEYYAAELPGKPRPEAIEDESGARHVLAVAGKGETRMVTVREIETGSQIELLRATEPASPAKPIKPRHRESFI
ncbi:MAG TPA: hypothetical protein VMY87_09375 [Armatimonadota bacterium]|nr:hypothetical protein [Armatimonadota bacterium]